MLLVCCLYVACMCLYVLVLPRCMLYVVATTVSPTAVAPAVATTVAPPAVATTVAPTLLPCPALTSSPPLPPTLTTAQGLCAHVAAGTAEQLVSLSAADLASHDQRVLREKLQAQQLQSRRTDWLEENKKTLQADIGIDPNNTWQYDEDDERMSEPDADPPDI
jgi:hypothetical protein